MFIDGNKCITLVQDVDGGGACACVGQEVYGNSLPLNIAVNLKLC